jgi:hypothetical protein
MNAAGFALRQGISRAEMEHVHCPDERLPNLTGLRRLAIMQGCSESGSQGSFRTEVAN